MPDCDHCEESFDEEAAYLRHLRDAHGDDLGPIEQRRVASLDDGDDGLPRAVTYGAAVLGVVIAGIVGYVLLGSLGGSADVDAAVMPSDVGSVHYHGTMNVTIDGETLDFSRGKYQLQADPFHYEGGDGSQWHVHARDVTLEYALKTLDIAPTRSSVTFDGTTYSDAAEGTSVSITVDGEPVNPKQYVLQRGDHVRVIVTTNGS